jgi:hypothetical protein
MKKLFFVLALMVIVSPYIQAQKGGGGRGGMQFGVKLGPSFSTWTGEDAEAGPGESKKMIIAPHLGVFMTIPLTTMLSLQPELLFSAQGVKYTYEDGYKEKYLTNHLNVPIALRIQMPSGFYIIVGPQVGFSLGGKYKWEFEDEDGEEDLEDLKAVAFSGVVGFGYQLPSGFGVYARYAHTFSAPFDFDEDVKINNSLIMLSFFYMLKLNK